MEKFMFFKRIQDFDIFQNYTQLKLLFFFKYKFYIKVKKKKGEEEKCPMPMLCYYEFNIQIKHTYLL